MQSNLFLLILSAVLAASSPQISEPSASWESMVMRLRSLDLVGGSACGAMAQPTEFFTLSQTMIASGTEQQFEDLLQDSHAVVRCMGLMGLAQMGGPEHARTIRSYLNDRGLVSYMPGGCLITWTTVGEFATRLLLSSGRILDYSGPPLPLMSKEQRVGLCIEILATDSAVIPQPHASSQLKRDIKAGRVRLEMAALRETACSLLEFEIIKAIGRLPRSTGQRDFLLGCLASDSVDNQGKLAAASALTRHTDDVAVQALHRKRDALNRLGERPWGDEFIATSEAMKAHEKAIPVFRIFSKRRPADFIDAVTNTHPLALGTLLKHMPWGLIPDDRDFRQAWVTSLIAISRRAGDFMQPWNTYADTTFKLDLWIELRHTAREEKTAMLAAFKDDEDWLTVEEYQEIERNLASALNRSLPQK